MARKRAVDGIQELIGRTGGPKVKATVTINQPYAQDQHETLYYRHPRGGRAKFLEAPLMESHRSWIQKFADDLLKPRRDAALGWGGVGRELAKAAGKNAPIEFGDLRQSAGLLVREGTRTVLDEPPKQGRLSEQELDAKDYMRSLGLGYR